MDKMLKFYVKVLYVMGKALSGELSYPCDRSCLVISRVDRPDKVVDYTTSNLGILILFLLSI